MGTRKAIRSRIWSVIVSSSRKLVSPFSTKKSAKKNIKKIIPQDTTQDTTQNPAISGTIVSFENAQKRENQRLFQDITITSGEYIDSTFRRCTLRGAMFKDCFISDSSLDDCKVTSSEIGITQGYELFDDKFYDSSAQDCEIRLCKLTNVEIHRSQIVNRSKINEKPPPISQCRIQTSRVESEEIRDCILNDCKLLVDVAFNVQLQDCMFERAPIRHARGLHITRSPLAFRKFPPEIRLLIFAEALADTWWGKTPHLITALRVDPVLYYEAMEVFISTNSFTLSPRNEKSPQLMSVKAWQNIQHMELR
jgi:uncharacterized protein YjbI with pentapeptide repeats